MRNITDPKEIAEIDQLFEQIGELAARRTRENIRAAIPVISQFASKFKFVSNQKETN